MVPSVATVLNGLARTMLMDLLPQNTHPYGGQTLQLGAALSMMCAQEFDRAADRLARENTALLRLFADAVPQVADAALRADLERAAAQAGDSLLVSALHARNSVLRDLLIRLHAHAETLGEPARQLNDRIWAELAESTERRRLDMAMA
jgi:hypothetical protein